MTSFTTMTGTPLTGISERLIALARPVGSPRGEPRLGELFAATREFRALLERTDG